MRQSGEYRIDASADAVWRALNDVDVLSRCIDGCQSMTRTADDAFEATVRAKIGPVSALFTAEVALADLDPPKSYTLRASAKGGAAGFGKGAAKVTLIPDSGGTLLRYEIDGHVGGKLAQIGQRLIDGAARKMADDFFGRFSEIVAPPLAEPALPVAEVAKLRPPWLWIALAAAMAALVALLLRH